MQTVSDFPGRGRRTANRGRALLIVAIIGLFFLIISFRGIAGFYTEYLWFESVGQKDVFTGNLGAKKRKTYSERMIHSGISSR